MYRRFEYRIAGNFRGRKLSRIGENTIFAKKNFVDCLLLSCRRTPRTKFCGKLSRIATKLRNLRMFFPSRVFRYMVTEVWRSDFPLQFMAYKPLQLTSTKTVTNRWAPRPDCHTVVVTWRNTATWRERIRWGSWFSPDTLEHRLQYQRLWSGRQRV